MDHMEFGRRKAVEAELHAATIAALRDVLDGKPTARVVPQSLVWDASSHFLMYPCMLGIRTLNVETHDTVRMTGKVESTERFCSLALYQGVPTISSQMSRALGVAGAVPIMGAVQGDATRVDPTLFATSWKRQRFFCFSNREPADVRPSDYATYVPMAFATREHEQTCVCE
ncbi:hypothetical protein EON66_04300 [archaeon]|nr:MAG: hypothetical protein EON66_04300 [archaeon]